MFFKKYGDYVVSGFFMSFSVAMLVLSTQIKKSKIMAIGPEFMPKVIATIMLILSIALLVSTISQHKVRVAEAEAMGSKKVDYKRVIYSLLLVLSFVLALKPVGFTLTSLLFLPLEMFVLAPDEERTKKDAIKYVIISTIFTFIVYFLFRYGFKILLPVGIFAINI